MNKYFTEIKNNTVIRVIVADNIDWCIKTLGGEWIETKKYDRDNYNYAGIGYMYDKDKKNFVPPKPFPSAVLNDKCQWNYPKEMPKDGKTYRWNEDKLAWIAFDITKRDEIQS